MITNSANSKKQWKEYRMPKRKLKTQVAIGILALFVLVAGLAFFGIQATVQEPRYIEAPTFGYISCQPEGGQRFFSKTFGAEKRTITCASDNEGILLGMNDGCSVKLIPPSTTSFLRREYAYSLNDGQYVYLEGGVGGYSGEQDAKTLQLKSNDVLQIAYGQVTTGNLLSEGQKYEITGNSFTLFNYNDLSSTNGQKLNGARTGNCILEDSFYTNKKIDFYDTEIIELKESDSKTLDYKNLNQPRGVYTYFKGWHSLPYFAPQIEKIDGNTAYCMDRALYRTLDIKSGGQTYTIVNYEKGGFIKDVVCCNGEETPDKLCVNHQFVAKEKVECDVSNGLFCPQSTFQSFGDKQYKRFVCEQKKCIPETIKVECNKNSDCLDGLTCSLNSDPTKNRCVQGGGGGGGQVIVLPSQTDLFGFLGKVTIFGLLIGALAGIVSLLVSLKSFGKTGVNLWLSIVLGIIVAILVVWVLTIYWWLALIVFIIFILLQIIFGRIFGITNIVKGLKGGGNA